VSGYVVVDSSVAVKWFKPHNEDSVREAYALLAAHRDERLTLTAPTHLLLEVLNVLRLHGLDADQLAQVASELDDFGIFGMENAVIFMN